MKTMRLPEELQTAARSIIQGMFNIQYSTVQYSNCSFVIELS